MIRPARPEDFPRLAELMRVCGLALEGVQYDRWGPVTLVSERRGEVVGFIQALLGAPYAVITEAAVDPRYHHQGISIRLLEHLETVLREYGVTAWVTFTGEKTDAARMLDRLAVRVHGTGTAYVRGLG